MVALQRQINHALVVVNLSAKQGLINFGNSMLSKRLV